MYSFSKLHWYEKTHLGKQNHTKNYWNIKCAWQSVLWPNHTLARCVFFYQYCLRGNWYIIYVSFQFYCVVTTHFTLDSNLNSSIHCSISKSNFQVSWAKLLLQKSALRCSKVSSGSEKRLHQIDQSECNIFCQNISNSNLNWYKDQPFSDWYIYKPVDMPHKWIGSTPK